MVSKANKKTEIKNLKENTKKEKQETKEPKKEEKPEKKEQVIREVEQDIEEKLEDWHDSGFETATREAEPMIKPKPKREEKGPEPETLEQSLAPVSLEKKEKEEKPYTTVVEENYLKESYGEKYSGRNWSEEKSAEEIKERFSRPMETIRPRHDIPRAHLVEDPHMMSHESDIDSHETIKYDIHHEEDKPGFLNPEFTKKYKGRKKL
jgi:hypothetical protein